jgi:hypothetical protein
MKNEIFHGTILTLAALVTSSSLGQSLTIEAESGVVSAPFSITNGYVHQPLRTSVTNGGCAIYTFAITNAGDYAIQALVKASSLTENSFYLNIDAEPQDPDMIWDIRPPTVGFQSRLVSWRGDGTAENNQVVPTYFSLTPGVHQLIIRGREANTQLDRLLFVKRPAPPTGLRIVAVP